MKYKIIVSMLVLIFLIGCTEKQLTAVPTCYDLCEYSKEDLYFKAPCSDIINLVRLEIDRKNFEEYTSNIIDEFKNNCRNFMMENLYYNLKKDKDITQDLRNITLEEFKGGMGEDLQMIIDYSCEVS